MEYIRFTPPESKGLTSEQVNYRKKQNLDNKDPKNISKPLKQIIKDNLFTSFNLFNFILAFFIILVGSYKNLLFLGIVFINTGIGIIQEIRSKRAVEKLTLLSCAHAFVRRDSKDYEINVNELVLDDITILNIGSQVCADSIIISGEVEVNESLLTGESEPVIKSKGEMLLSGSFIVSGNCLAKVEHVGEENYAVKIAMEAKKQTKKHSVLMDSLNKIVTFTGIFILPLGLILFLKSYFMLSQSLEYSVISTSAALLGMMPKGLVLLTSLTLTVVVMKLAKKRVLVRELFSTEILPNVDVLCLDKTGTITQGKMKVLNTYYFNGNFDKKEFKSLIKNFLGSLKDNNSTFLALKEYFGEEKNLKIQTQIPFSSSRKFSAVSFENIGTLVLGAPEVLMKYGNFSLPYNIIQAQEDGNRVVMFCFTKDILDSELTGNLCPMMSIVMTDELRKGARETLEYFEKEGVDIKIISGDSPVTVSNIAKKVGIKDYNSYIDMSEINSLAGIKKAVKENTILARVSPYQKKEIVCALKNQGHRVAMTGDGVNDVLALKEANCSIAMAQGSDAAVQVSDLVLIDSDFTVLPNVVAQGRRVINNITRTSSLFLVKTIFSFLLSFIVIFFNMPYPFVPIQLTLISVIFEAIPSFILAFEPNDEKTNKKFLTTVLNNAFPTGLIIVLSIIVINLLQPFINLTQNEVTTLCYYITGFVWSMQLFKICKPFNKIRATLWGFMSFLFVFLSIYFKSIIGISNIDILSFIVLILLSLIYFPVNKKISYLISKYSLVKELNEIKLYVLKKIKKRSSHNN